jgi:hypothetical protein
MDAIRSLTENINVFVRFFQSINCLFFQIRWLEENVGRSRNGVMLLVIGIVALCVMLSFGVDLPGLGEGTSSLLPFLAIFAVIGFVFHRRMNRGRGGNGNGDPWGNVMYGGNDPESGNNGDRMHNQGDGRQEVEAFLPSAPPMPVTTGIPIDDPPMRSPGRITKMNTKEKNPKERRTPYNIRI